MQSEKFKVGLYVTKLGFISYLFGKFWFNRFDQSKFKFPKWKGESIVIFIYKINFMISKYFNQLSTIRICPYALTFL